MFFLSTPEKLDRGFEIFFIQNNYFLFLDWLKIGCFEVIYIYIYIYFEVYKMFFYMFLR